MEEKNESKLKKLIAQILKFGVVGGLSFLIDFVITTLVDTLLSRTGIPDAMATGINSFVANFSNFQIGRGAVSSATGSVFGFCISLIFNYIMSMKYVFARKDDMNRKKEFTIFLVLSLIGLLINTAIMTYGVTIVEGTVPEWAAQHHSLVTMGVKIIATGIVMVYNFISRKIALEKKD